MARRHRVEGRSLRLPDGHQTASIAGWRDLRFQTSPLLMREFTLLMRW